MALHTIALLYSRDYGHREESFNLDRRSLEVLRKTLSDSDS